MQVKELECATFGAYHLSSGQLAQSKFEKGK
jgi:hypothetical protein